MTINTNKVLAVVGSRTFNDYSYLKEKLLLHKPKRIISGGAEGADSLAQRFCKEFGLPILIFYPDWKTYNKSAGMIRNSLIVNECEELVAFPVNNSKGTADSIRKAREVEKIVYIYTERR